MCSQVITTSDALVTESARNDLFAKFLVVLRQTVSPQCVPMSECFRAEITLLVLSIYALAISSVAGQHILCQKLLVAVATLMLKTRLVYSVHLQSVHLLDTIVAFFDVRRKISFSSDRLFTQLALKSFDWPLNFRSMRFQTMFSQSVEVYESFGATLAFLSFCKIIFFWFCGMETIFVVAEDILSDEPLVTAITWID